MKILLKASAEKDDVFHRPTLWRQLLGEEAMEAVIQEAHEAAARGEHFERRGNNQYTKNKEPQNENSSVAV